MKESLRNLRLNDTQGEVVFLLGILAVIKGIGFIFNPDAPVPTVVRYSWDNNFILDNGFWAVVWIINGLFCLYYAFKFDDRVALVVTAVVYGLWMMAYLADWVLHFFLPGFAGSSPTTFILYFVMLVILMRWHGRRSKELLAMEQTKAGGDQDVSDQ